MTAAAASRPWRAAGPAPSRREIAVFALALAVSGLVTLTLVFAGPSTYADIARASGREAATFRTSGPPPQRLIQLELPSLLGYHGMWVDYVTGRTAGIFTHGGGLFTPAEYSHMADVRTVFVMAQVAAALAALLLLWLAVRASRRGALARLVRGGAIVALVAVALVGALGAVAFDAAFMLFHQVFFPQGNFSFPAESNLLALYPEAYFYGVTVRIGVAFVAAALALAGAAHLSVRRYGPSA